jgi:hypothetical protein
MATTPAPTGSGEAENLVAEGVPAVTGVEPARVTLTIDIGTLTPETVAAIAAFVKALADDPAKAVSSGPKPADPPTPGGGAQA